MGAVKSQQTPQQVRRKLNRAQILEILERNVALYKNEDSFVPYLLDLTLYMLEFEYDWSESGLPPPNLRAKPDHSTPSGESSEAGAAKIVQGKINPMAVHQPKKSCPFCGGDVGDRLICPSCKNLTR